MIHLKPKDRPKLRNHLGFVVLPDGREICDLKTASGKREYKARIKAMLLRQKGTCGLCGQPLAIEVATFDHADGRGLGGSRRDDRIFFPDGEILKEINLAAHYKCNAEKGSIRLDAYLLSRTR
jgi:hypothetical protein